MLNHVALNIIEPREVIEFYKDVLEFSEDRRFILNQDLSKKIFDIDQSVGVFLLSKEDLVLELFVVNEPVRSLYSHTCIKVADKDNVIKKATAKDYVVKIIKRIDSDDMVFIKDKTGNMFELK